MIFFALGLISGLLIATLIVVTITFFRKTIEEKIEIIEKKVSGPRPKGFIVDPIDVADEIREKVIQKNKDKGQDTPIEELR